MAVIQFPAGCIVRPPIDLSGIQIISRHDVEAKIDGMGAMLVEVLRAGMPDEHWIRSIGCNSKFSPCFRIVLGMVEDDGLLDYTAKRLAAQHAIPLAGTMGCWSKSEMGRHAISSPNGLVRWPNRDDRRNAMMGFWRHMRSHGHRIRKLHNAGCPLSCVVAKTLAVVCKNRGGTLSFQPKETLPDQCPPEGALPLSGRFVRLVDGPTIDARFCDSFNKMGRPLKKKVSPCVWAACSLVIYDEDWVAGPIARVVDFAKVSRLLDHKKFGAIMHITPECGVGYRGTEESPHFSFWMASTFDPIAAVSEVVSLL